MNSTVPGSAPRVLLVDDAPDTRLLMSLYLRRSGVEILTARNGEEALQVTASMQPDLVVLDLTTSGMSCYEVCKRIKANPETSHTPVVFVISTDERAERIKGLQVGADDFFSKPIEKDEFLVRVKSLVNGHQARKRQVGGIVAEEADASEVRDQFDHLRTRKLVDRALVPAYQAGRRSATRTVSTRSSCSPICAVSPAWRRSSPPPRSYCCSTSIFRC